MHVPTLHVVVFSGRVVVEDRCMYPWCGVFRSCGGRGQMHVLMVWCFQVVWWSRTDACTHGVVFSGRVVVEDSTDDNFFEGFFVQARLADGSTTTAHGTFSNLNTDYIQTLTCGGVADVSSRFRAT